MADAGVPRSGQKVRQHVGPSRSAMKRLSAIGRPVPRFTPTGKWSLCATPPIVTSCLPVSPSTEGEPSPTSVTTVKTIDSSTTYTTAVPVTPTAVASRPSSSPPSPAFDPRSRLRETPPCVPAASSSSHSTILLPSAPISAPSPSSDTSNTGFTRNSNQNVFESLSPQGHNSSKRYTLWPPILARRHVDILSPINATPLSSFQAAHITSVAPCPSNRSVEAQDFSSRELHPATFATTGPRRNRRRIYNPYNLPDIPSPSLYSTVTMTTSPQSPNARVEFPTSPTNYTPKEIRSKPPSTASSANKQPNPNIDVENQAQAPTSPSERSIAWTPAHPCYPHMNSHVPKQDPRAESTRVIRVPRDWMIAGDLYPQFSDIYPVILAPWITEQEFRALVNGINDASRAAFEPTTARAWFDSVMGYATGWLWEDLGLTGGKLGASKCERMIEAWNKKCRSRRAVEQGGVGAAVGADDTEDAVECVSLRRTAWMTLDFVIPDPKVSFAPEGADEPGNRPSPAEAAPTPRGPGSGSVSRTGDRDLRETSHNTSRKSSGEMLGRGVQTQARSSVVVRKTSAELDWTIDVEKGDDDVGVAM